MRQRNMKAAKRLGTKALAGVLAIGLIVSTPAAVLADGETETAGTQSTASQTPVIQAEKLQAKSVDGKDTLTDVSDTVIHLLCRHLRGPGPDRSGRRRCCGRLLRSDGRLCRDEL